MKKFLVILIFLIPVIVVIAIQSTGAVVQAWAPAVNAETIEIRNAYNENIGGGRIIIPRFFTDSSDGSDYIYIDVYPKVAYSHEISYSTSDEEGYNGRCELVHVEKNKYKLTARSSGNVLMRVFSATNNNAFKQLSVYITSDLITSIDLYADDGEAPQKVEEDGEIPLQGQTRLFALAYPAEAIGNNFITWESDDEKVASVDKNGMVTATGKGRAKITCRVKDKTSHEHFSFIHVNVEEDTPLKQSKIYIEKDFFTKLTDDARKTFILDNLVHKPDKQTQLGMEILTEDDIKLCASDSAYMTYKIDGADLRIEYAHYNDIVLKSDYLRDVYLENGGYSLVVAFKDYRRRNDIPKADYITSDSSVADIDNAGRLIPKKEGTCTVYARFEGFRTQSVDISIKRRVTSFQLNYSNFDNNRGIKQERVWGQSFFRGGELTNEYLFGYQAASVHPSTNSFELIWESDNPHASVDGTGKITFSGAAGEIVNITATAVVHGIKSALSRKYTFHMAEGDVINVYGLEEFDMANSHSFGKKAVALQNVITVPERREVNVNNDLYGNGYLFNFIFPDDTYRYDASLLVSQNSFNESKHSYLLENFTVQCGETYQQGRYKSSCIYLSGMEIDGAVKYVIARYAWNSIMVSRNKGTLTIEGCILGATGFTSVYFSNNHYTSPDDVKGTLILRNNVMRETDCASLVTAPESFEPDILDNYVQNVVFEGFMDSYNWRKVEELSVIFNAIDENMLGDLREAKEFLARILGSMLNTYFSREPYKSAVYTDETGQQWVCMHLFSVGMCQTVDAQSFDLSGNPELILVPVVLNKGDAKLIGGLLGFDMTLPNYMLSYKFDAERGPIIKPKDACPENEELFNKLCPKAAEEE